jgi:DNA-binding NarL/FixJ family response regulator
MMNELKERVVKGQALDLDNKNLDVAHSITEFISFQGNFDKIQLLHKINRVLFEFEYARKNHCKFILLTQREKQIIKLVVSGCNNPEISKKLFISRRTVEQHRKNINRKLEMNCLQEVCVFAYAFDLV